ncbi:hypothetical protein NM688_g6905 [Phlebia brevispora]|uniref:Uncharacterized protein n=1 Tax=Phlebia brevispora TaxID=194682 RepID=A0ACC1SB74_9APHY|nr:hypothetical protein NM688_g6905 [Phlebia brevispora]
MVGLPRPQHPCSSQEGLEALRLKPPMSTNGGTGYPWIVHAMPTPEVARPAPSGVLYPYIAANRTPIPFDLRKNPRRARQQEFLQHHHYSLFSQPVREMRLVCKDFPWPIEIKDEWILCGTVWQRIYDTLQEYITDSEWAIASHERRGKIYRAVRWREAETGNRNMKPRRIDWLGEKTIFAGLLKDEAFVQEIAMPGHQESMDTWIIKLSRR